MKELDTTSHLKFVNRELRIAIECLKTGGMKVPQAGEIINACGKMINAAKVEIEAAQLLKRDPNIELEFLKEQPAKADK